MKSATIIYNPTAGWRPRKRERQVREAASSLETQGISVQIVPTTGPDTARGLARDAVARGEELIVVCGGDGTINEVINGIAPGKTTLGILPGGTANIFAKELGLPHHPVRAARELVNWVPRRIALGRATWPKGNGGQIESRFFLSLAGIGFDAYIVRKLALEFKKDWGVVAYIWEAIRQTLRYPFPTFVCRINGREIYATFALVQRTKRYAGWLRMAPGAEIFEPHFSLCAFKSRHWWRYFIYAAAVIARQHLRLADVELVQTQKIDCGPGINGTVIDFELDGELAGQLPVTFEIVPDALTVLVPPVRVDGRQ
ncbi:MAG: diacylglycerol/lipid kinase family protein [Terriglobia bacterium]